MGLPSLRVANSVTLLPDAVAVPTVTPAEQLLSAFAGAGLAGQLIVGGSSPVSMTVMLKEQEPPPVSEVAVTTVVPTGKNEPEAGTEDTEPQSPEEMGSS